MHSEEDFFSRTYPSIWRKAYLLGNAAREAELPRECNLTDELFLTPSGAILKVYKSAWEQGWDHYVFGY